MEPKKNPKADLTKRSTLFFQIGMIIMLFIAWQAIEWKSYDRSNIDSGLLDVGDELDEEMVQFEFPAGSGKYFYRSADDFVFEEEDGPAIGHWDEDDEIIIYDD